MRVFCISGKAQHGKDTVGSIIRQQADAASRTENSALIVHNADLLKFICKLLFDWNGEKDIAGRTLLQVVGTDIIRTANPNYWVDWLIELVGFFKNAWTDVIVPDCRFPNEIQRWKDAGHQVYHVRVERNQCEDGMTDQQRAHSSETALEGYPVDILIQNNGTMQDLREQVSAQLKFIFNPESQN